jgi:y4mF family transcriptional regulator
VLICLFPEGLARRKLRRRKQNGTIVPREGAMAEAFEDLLAAEVRARRGQLDLTQQDLADMAGVSERFVRFVEQGKPSIQLNSLLAVLETLGLELRLATRTSQAARSLGGPVATSSSAPETYQ